MPLAVSSIYVLIVWATAEDGRREMNKLLTLNYFGHDITSVVSVDLFIAERQGNRQIRSG
jgi:hypothetical protein